MAHQASVNGGGRVPIDPASAVVANLTEFGNDIATLTELQLKLAALDLAETKRRAVVPIALIVLALGLALGLIPVLLFGIAQLIAESTNLRLGWALVLTAVGALVVAGVLGALAGPALSRSLESFRRSREELVRNVSWVRTVLVHSGRGGPRRF